MRSPPAPCSSPISGRPAPPPSSPDPCSGADPRPRSLVLAPPEAYNRRDLKALEGRTTHTSPRGTPARPDEYVEAVEAVSREIRDPVAKLRFLRSSLKDYPRLSPVEDVPSGRARRILYRWASLESLRLLTGKEPVASVAP